MNIEEIGSKVIDCAYTVHKALGPGLLESCYEVCLCHELSQRGIPFERQKPLPVIYDDVKLDAGFRIDILVDNQIVIELKAVDALNDIHRAQLLTYLKLGGYKLGYLINFNTVLLKDGLRRMVNNL